MPKFEVEMTQEQAEEFKQKFPDLKLESKPEEKKD